MVHLHCPWTACLPTTSCSLLLPPECFALGLLSYLSIDRSPLLSQPSHMCWLFINDAVFASQQYMLTLSFDLYKMMPYYKSLLTFLHRDSMSLTLNATYRPSRTMHDPVTTNSPFNCLAWLSYNAIFWLNAIPHPDSASPNALPLIYHNW